MKAITRVALVAAISLLSSGRSFGDLLDYYDVESILLPEGEFSVDALAFLPDGRLVCSLSMSTVYIYNPDTKEWKVFAEGLHTPLGLLPTGENKTLVMQRPELTALSDTDGDGRADHFKTVSDYFGLSGNYAEFVAGPVRDEEGNLFFGLGTGSHYGQPLTHEVRGAYSPEGHWGRMNTPVPYRGWIMKVTPEGETIPWASGFREPNGLGFDPDGRLFAIDNQGDWVGASAIYHVEQGGHYGHVPSLVWREEFRDGRQPLELPVQELDRIRSRPAVVFPYGDMSNSPTQPLWDETGGKFGPFSGQGLIGEMNFKRVMRLMLEVVDGQVQGAVAPMLEHEALNRGNNRLAFAPDGSLWIGQTKHEAWVGESGLQRVAWKGVDPMDVKTMTLTEDGFRLAFTRPVDPKQASKKRAYSLSSYFYNYHEAYGSDKFDERPVKIKSVEVADDLMSVTLHLKDLEAWRLYDLKLKQISSNDGHPVLNPWIVYTVNRRLHDTPPPPPPIATPRPERRTPEIPAGGFQSVGEPKLH